MRLSRREAGGVTVVDVDGGADHGSSLVELVAGLLDDGVRRLVLNLRSHSLDSNALGQATGCWLKTKHRGGVLKIATRQPKVWELVRTLKLDRVVECYRSEEEAVDSFEPSSS
ncbi:MAG TPA: STAS domain-containing protein [Candidatus Binatia bacterium]|nr:STAS domain-containing protein [Candidatus Binatia bacterium]